MRWRLRDIYEMLVSGQWMTKLQFVMLQVFLAFMWMVVLHMNLRWQHRRQNLFGVTWKFCVIIEFFRVLGFLKLYPFALSDLGPLAFVFLSKIDKEYFESLFIEKGSSQRENSHLNSFFLHGQRTRHIVKFVIKSTSVAYWLPMTVTSPQGSCRGITVIARQASPSVASCLQMILLWRFFSVKS